MICLGWAFECLNVSQVRKCEAWDGVSCISAVRKLFLLSLLWRTVDNWSFLFVCLFVFNPNVLHRDRFTIVFLSSFSASDIHNLSFMSVF